MVKYFSKMKKHKVETATVIAESLEAPTSIAYINALKNVASNPLVENGLNMGKVIVYPIRPELLPWPHIVYTRGQMPMDMTYVTNEAVSNLLKLADNPATRGAITIAAAAAPFAVYAGYKMGKHAWPTVEKNVGELSREALPDFAHEKLNSVYKSINKKLGK